ncbi:MAG: YkgJ family cysteine cluster protein [Phycisphaerae bacterium]
MSQDERDVSEQPAGAGEVEAQPQFVEIVSRIRGHLEAVRDLPGLGQFKETHRLPAAFFTEFNAALAEVDVLIDFVLDFTGTTGLIQCRKGCANCCIDLVRGINTPETINIYHHVRSWPDVKQIFEYLRDSAEQFMEILESKLRPGEFEFGGSDERVLESHREYNRLNRRCGFLDAETGCCRIYPVRPIACRYFFSLDPPEMCTPTHEKYFSRNTRTVHLPPEVHEVILEIGQRLGFRPLNYLAGAFCGFASEIMHARPVQVVDDGAA